MSSRVSSADDSCTIPLLDMPNVDHFSNAPNTMGLSDDEVENFSLDAMDSVLRSVQRRPRSVSRLQCVTSSAFCSSVAFSFGFLLAYILYTIIYPPNCVHRNKVLSHSASDDALLIRALSPEVNPEVIRGHLWNLTRKPHIGGSYEQLELAKYLRDVWTRNGISDVNLIPYDVLLSFANNSNPNQIHILDVEKKTVVLRIIGTQRPIHSPEEHNVNVTATFNAYSSSGTVEGDLVYVNYGESSDFEYLRKSGITVNGSIVLARYGKSFRGNIVSRAEEYGAIGVILFSDPAGYASEGRQHVYPFADWLPGSGVQSGSVYIRNGDPSTPNYPSTAGAYRVTDVKELHLPSIPVQPISYDDAEKLFRYMGGSDSPPDWKGGLNVSYKVGPGFINDKLKAVLDVRTHNANVTIYNVIGIIPGSEEPDRYVILGNHRDAWIFGAIDPSSGTAVLTEIIRVLGQMLKTGWKPRRTIVLCSWGAEEHGLVGSWEWVEDKAKLLQERAVAYLNVDCAVDGNYTLRVKAVPSLYDAVYNASKKIPNPNPAEVAQGRKTVYDTWLYTSYNETSPPPGSVPSIHTLGSGSDFSGFIFLLGVPSLDFVYDMDHKKYKFGNPLYHSLYETFYAVDELVDPGFHYHAAIAKLWAETARTLCDARILPFNFVTYAVKIKEAFEKFSDKYKSLLTEQNISLEYLEMAIENFTKAATHFSDSQSTQDLENPLVRRMINDKIMQVERSFIAPEGIPLSPQNKHVLLSTSANDAYSGEYFPGLVDLISTVSSSPKPAYQWELFKQHLASVSYYINSAAAVLSVKWHLSDQTRTLAMELFTPKNCILVSTTNDHQLHKNHQTPWHRSLVAKESEHQSVSCSSSWERSYMFYISSLLVHAIALLAPLSVCT